MWVTTRCADDTEFQSHAGSIYLGNRFTPAPLAGAKTSFNPTLVRSTSATQRRHRSAFRARVSIPRWFDLPRQHEEKIRAKDQGELFQSHAGSIYLGNRKAEALLPRLVGWFQSHAGSIYLGNYGRGGVGDRCGWFQSHAGSIYLGNASWRKHAVRVGTCFNPMLVRSTSATSRIFEN